MTYLSYLAATAIGISLGLIGAGGSILTVPVLVYLAGIEPVLATGYSLFVVGSTAFVGGIQNTRKGMVDLKTAFLFGIPSILAVYATRAWLMPLIPNTIFEIGGIVVSKGAGLLILFAGLMIATSFSMILDRGPIKEKAEKKQKNLGWVFAEGIGVGTLTGLVGAGGGFLIIPALVLLAGLEMKIAIGTSLFIIAMKSLIGFIGDIQNSEFIDWRFLAIFTSFSIGGIFIGARMSRSLDGRKLKRGFGFFVLAMGCYMVAKEIFFP